MSLENWFKQRLISQHAASLGETTKLFKVVDRDLHDSGVGQVSNDARFLAAYNAALTICRIALAACGYSVPKGGNQHYHTIDSLALTLGNDFKGMRDYLDQCRRRRNTGFYEQVGIASADDAEELRSTAIRLRKSLVEWLRANHPSLLQGNE